MLVPKIDIERRTSIVHGAAPTATVVFVPYDAMNPYQPQIVQGLRDLGHTVLEYDSFWEAYADILSGKIRPDILHLHWLYFLDFRLPWGRAVRRAAGFVKGLLTLRRRGVRIVWTVHNGLSHECPRPRVEKLTRILTGRMADRIIVHSVPAQKLVHRSWFIRQSHIAVVPHPHYIDVYQRGIGREEAERALGLTPAALRYVFLGAIRRYKGVLELIDAFKRLDCADVQLLVAGKVRNDEQLLEEIECGIGGDRRITLQPGFIADDDIQKYMAVADVAVLPYSEALTSGAAILAMSFGRPCVVPETGAFRSVLDDRGAFFYEITRADGLKHAMQEAFADRDLLASYGRHNHQRAKEWAPERIAAQTGRLYGTLLAGNGSVLKS